MNIYSSRIQWRRFIWNSKITFYSCRYIRQLTVFITEEKPSNHITFQMPLAYSHRHLRGPNLITCVYPNCVLFSTLFPMQTCWFCVPEDCTFVLWRWCGIHIYIYIYVRTQFLQLEYKIVLAAEFWQCTRHIGKPMTCGKLLCLQIPFVISVKWKLLEVYLWTGSSHKNTYDMPNLYTHKIYKESGFNKDDLCTWNIICNELFSIIISRNY